MKAPVLGVSNVKAKYTLIHFWSNEDKASKTSGVNHGKGLKDSTTNKIALVAVDFEPLKLAYDEFEDTKDVVYCDAYKAYKLRKSLAIIWLMPRVRWLPGILPLRVCHNTLMW